jgi:hypothetical protein
LREPPLSVDQLGDRRNWKTGRSRAGLPLHENTKETALALGRLGTRCPSF